MTTDDLRKLMGALKPDVSPAHVWDVIDNSIAVPPVTNRDHEIAESRIDSGTFGNTCVADYTNLREEQAFLKEDYERQCASEFRDDNDEETE